MHVNNIATASFLHSASICLTQKLDTTGSCV